MAYHVPYDGDTEDHPNLFLIKKPVKSITVADVKQVPTRTCVCWFFPRWRHLRLIRLLAALRQCFPLPGTYFFRAKQTYGKTYGASSEPAVCFLL